MDLADLHYFLLVARARSFSKGAALAHVSPPAISKAIQRLEADLDTTLFHRTTRSVALTGSGRLLVERGERIAREVDDARHALEDLSDTLRGPLRIAANEVFSVELVPRAIAQLVDEAEAVVPELFEMLPDAMSEQVAKGHMDLGFTIGATSTARVACDAIGTSRGALVCGQGHPLFVSGRVTKAQLAEHRSAVPRFWGQPALPSLDQFNDAQTPRRIGATAELLQSIVELALSGRFLAYVPEISVRGHLAAGRLKALSGLRGLPQFELQMLTRRGPVQRPATRRLGEIVKKLIANAGPKPGRH